MSPKIFERKDCLSNERGGWHAACLGRSNPGKVPRETFRGGPEANRQARGPKAFRLKSIEFTKALFNPRVPSLSSRSRVVPYQEKL